MDAPSVENLHVITPQALTQEQEGIFDSIMATPKDLHVLTGTLGSSKSFFIKYITRYFQLEGKTILLLGTTGAIVRWLSRTTNTVHTTFRIPTQKYLSCLIRSSKILNKINTSYEIIIDKMSMMTSYVLCAIE